MATYSVRNYDSGELIAANRSLEAAAEYLLRSDGFEWSIRREVDGEGWRLWHSSHSAASVMGAKQSPTSIFSLEEDESAATAEIFQRVVDFGEWQGAEAFEDVPAPTTLEDLKQALERQDVWLGAPIAHGELDWSALPKFGGEEPGDTNEVWSWDADRLLVGSCRDDLEIVDR